MDFIELDSSIIVDGQVIGKGEKVSISQEMLEKGKKEFANKGLRSVMSKDRGDTETVLATTNNMVMMLAGAMAKLVDAIATADNLNAVKKAAEEAKAITAPMLALNGADMAWKLKGADGVVSKAIEQSQAVVKHLKG